MKEAHDHHRVSPEGRRAGAAMAKLADAECRNLAARNQEPDTRCKTCAFRAGAVPNGCAQTMGDAYKAVAEDVPFMCHQKRDAAGRPNTVCHGWFALRCIADRMEAATGEKLPPAPWEFSPPDEVTH